MSTYRLKESHPTFKKIREPEALAEKLIKEQDVDKPGIEFEYRDIEQDAGSFEVTQDFPCDHKD